MKQNDTPEVKARRAGGTSARYAPAPPAPSLRVVSPTKLLGLPVPQRRWIVPEWLPVGYTTIQFGDGGTGKTLDAQQLVTACATGTLWLGMQVERCRVFGLFCEDDDDELHGRQDQINAAMGLNFSDLADMRWASGVGEDNILMVFPPGGPAELTPRYHDIVREAKNFGAKLVVIDTAADTFGGNENARPEVRQFIGRALNHLAREIGGAVLLNAHPSVRGMGATGDMDGGSTAWSNTARSRWSLVRPKSDEMPADTDERILTRRKANYSSIGDEIKLRWMRGVLVPTQATSATSSVIGKAAAASVFLTLLDAATVAGRPVSDSKNGGNFAPKAFAKSPNRNGYTQADFLRAMEDLFATGAIIMERYGRKGDERRRIARAVQSAGEEGAN